MPINSKELLELYDYDIIVSGDNHQAFYTKHDGKVLINGGGYSDKVQIRNSSIQKCSYMIQGK